MMAASVYWLRLNQIDSSYLVLASLAILAIAAGILFYTGLIGWFLGVLDRLLLQFIALGFRQWERFLGWAPWPVFLALVMGAAAGGLAATEDLPGLTILCGLVLSFMGVVACLAYMFIDLERYEVERGHKAVHNPLKGQEPALYLARYGQRVGLFLLVSAAIATLAGFSLLNQGLYQTIGHDWYRVREGELEPAFVNFLTYTLINALQLVDVLNLAGSQHLLETSYVTHAAWPAWLLLLLFKSFLTLVLLRQLFTSIRQERVLNETIADFWSPHEPIHERALSGLPMYGTTVIQPLLVSLRSVGLLTKEQRDELPQILAATGPSAIPALIRHLHDPHEHVRTVAAAALGHLHVNSVVPLLAALGQDSSELVRASAVEALGVIGAWTGRGSGPSKRYARSSKIWRRLAILGWWKRRPRAAAGNPVEAAVTALASELLDISPALRTQAAQALSSIGPPYACPATPILILLLNDQDETVRCQAAEALGRLGGNHEETVPALVPLLEEPSNAVKIAAAHALGALKTTAAPALRHLLPLLQDREENVRTAAAQAVAQVGPLNEAATDSLTQGLASPDNVVRAHTAETLGTIGTAAHEAAPALVEALEGDGSDRVRAKAVEALGKIGEAAADVAVPSLVRALRDQDVWVSALAAEALGQMGDAADEAVPALVRSLTHANALVRANATEALAKMGNAASVARPALERVAKDEDGGVRHQAVRALGAIGPPTPAAADIVLAACRDADPLVRSAAAEALGQWGPATETQLAELMPLLEDPNDQVKVQVMQVLPKVAGATPAVLDGLCRRLLEDDSALVQERAAQALGKLGTAAASVGGALLQIVQTGEVSVREQAMRAIAAIQPPEMAEAFALGLKDTSSAIRKVASGGWMKAVAIPEEVIPSFVDALRDPEPQVRANAAHALSRLDTLPPEAVPFLVECTTDSSDGLRLNAAMALKLAPPGAVGKVLEQLIDDRSLRVRLIAASLLLATDAENPKAHVVLAEALNDASPRVREAALELKKRMAAATLETAVQSDQGTMAGKEAVPQEKEEGEPHAEEAVVQRAAGFTPAVRASPPG